MVASKTQYRSRIQIEKEHYSRSAIKKVAQRYNQPSSLVYCFLSPSHVCLQVVKTTGTHHFLEREQFNTLPEAAVFTVHLCFWSVTSRVYVKRSLRLFGRPELKVPTTSADGDGRMPEWKERDEEPLRSVKTLHAGFLNSRQWFLGYACFCVLSN